MTVGRKPKPTALRLIEGNPGKRPMVEASVDFGPLGEPPADLAGAALDKWHEMSRTWGLVATAADRPLMAEYCRLEVERLEAMEVLKTESPVSFTGGGAPIQSPWKVILNSTRDRMFKIAVEFGGSPASRSRVSAPVGGKAKTKFSGLIKEA